MAHIRVQCLRAGHRKDDGTERQHAAPAVGVQESRRVHGVDRRDHRGSAGNGRQGDERNRDEPEDHHRAKDRSDSRRSAMLHEKQHDQDHDGDWHDPRIKYVGRDAEAFDRAQDRDGWRDHAVSIKQPGAEEPERNQGGVPRLSGARANQCDERQDPALAGIVGAHHKDQVLDRDGHNERPQDERQHPEDIWCVDRDRAGAGEALPEGVQRARPDVAEDDAERGDDRETASGPQRLNHPPSLDAKSRPSDLLEYPGEHGEPGHNPG